MNSTLLRPAAVALLMCATRAHAAGGHFDVDDASILDPGRCQVETWLSHYGRPSALLTHLGPSCRLGDAEVGLGFDHLDTAGARLSTAQLQSKWARPVGPLQAGVVLGVTADIGHGGKPAYTAYVPVTWPASERWAFNLNLGIDQDFEGKRGRRAGISTEFQAGTGVLLIGERVDIGGSRVTRLGARFAAGKATSIDVSAARLGSPSHAVLTLGLNTEFGR